MLLQEYLDDVERARPGRRGARLHALPACGRGRRRPDARLRGGGLGRCDRPAARKMLTEMDALSTVRAGRVDSAATSATTRSDSARSAAASSAGQAIRDVTWVSPEQFYDAAVAPISRSSPGALIRPPASGPLLTSFPKIGEMERRRDGEKSPQPRSIPHTLYLSIHAGNRQHAPPRGRLQRGRETPLAGPHGRSRTSATRCRPRRATSAVRP